MKMEVFLSNTHSTEHAKSGELKLSGVGMPVLFSSSSYGLLHSPQQFIVQIPDLCDHILDVKLLGSIVITKIAHGAAAFGIVQ